MIHLLDRIGKLPTMKVEIERRREVWPQLLHGRSVGRRSESIHGTTDKYDVKALVQEVGEWNTMIAATFGAMNDMLKASGSSLALESPISAFPDFEQLGIQGAQNHKYLAPFLQAMKQLADKQREALPKAG